MKCHHRLGTALKSAGKSKTEKSPGQHSSHVKMKDVVVQSREKSKQFGGSFGIVDFIGIKLPVPCDVNDGAGYSLML
jgi:hypothetical protein